MRIARNRRQWERGKVYGGMYEVELTPQEISDAYRLMMLEFCAADIGEALDWRLEDEGKDENEFCKDWVSRFAEEASSKLMDMMDDDIPYRERYNELVNDVIDKVLAENGWDRHFERINNEERGDATCGL